MLAFAGSFPDLWRPLAMIGAAFGIVFFAVLLDGRTQHLVNQGVIGVAVSVVLFLSALARIRLTWRCWPAAATS